MENKISLMLLAAGFSTRLEPRTLSCPKQLLPVGSGVLADLLIDTLKSSEESFDKKIIISNEKFYSQFSDWAKKLDGYEVISDGVMNKGSRLGAIGDVLFGLAQTDIGGDVVILTTDFILSDFDLQKFLTEFERQEYSYTLAAHEVDKAMLSAGSCLEIDKGELVTRFEEKPAEPFSDLYGVPYYFIKKQDIDIIKSIAKEKMDNSGELVHALADHGRIKARIYDGPAIHLTSEQDYQELLAKY